MSNRGAAEASKPRRDWTRAPPSGPCVPPSVLARTGVSIIGRVRACVRGSPDRDSDTSVLLDRYPITSILSLISHGVCSLIGFVLHFLALGEIVVAYVNVSEH